jgi:hypothetical protein
MVGQGKAEIDPNTGRIQRGTSERQTAFEKMNSTVDKALKTGEVDVDAVLAAASILVTALRNHAKEVINEKTEDAFVWLYELLDRRLGQTEEEAHAPKRRKARA